MYDVFYYKDKDGNCPIKEYIDNLAESDSKDSRIKLNKIYDYIKYLSKVGIQAKEPYAKHLDGEIWELRPIRDRILYAAWNNDSFILLHRFMKETQKTPQREINKVKRNLTDYRERDKENG